MPVDRQNLIPKTTLLVELAYDGRAFHGVQPQPGLRTVGGALRERVHAHFAQSPSALTFAARTDAGVSAKQNFATFRLRHTPELDTQLQSFCEGSETSSGLPSAGLHIRQIQPVSRKVNARNSSTGKLYSYRIVDTPAGLSSLSETSEDGPAWHIAVPLDVARMQQAARELVGQHDFSSFRARGCSAKSPHKILRSISVERRGHGVLLELEGDNFLRKMVRIICGTLAEAGAGLRSPQSMAEVLACRSRRAAGLTAPAQGLTLMRVDLKRP